MNWINGFELLCYGITLLFLVDVIGERKKRKSENEEARQGGNKASAPGLFFIGCKKSIISSKKGILHDICFRLENAAMSSSNDD